MGQSYKLHLIVSGVGQNMNTENAVAGKASSVDSIPGKPPLPPTNSSASNGVVVPKTASIRARPASSRITATEIQQIFEDKVKNGEANGKLSPDVNCHKIYASVAEMKRSKVNRSDAETNKVTFSACHRTSEN